MRAAAALGCALLVLSCGRDELAPLDSPNEPEEPVGISVPRQGPGDSGDEVDDPSGEPDETPAPGDEQPEDVPPDAPDADPDPVDEEPPPGVCDLVEDAAGACQNYGYDCDAYPEAESWCFLEVLESLPNACELFLDDNLCSGPWVSDVGDASCRLQECFGLTTYVSCYESLVILCEFAWNWG